MVPGRGSLHIVLLWTLGVWIAGVHSSDPCDSYTTIDENWRDPAYFERSQNETNHCDQFTAGWYAFLLGDHNAEIPRQCLQDDVCGGKVSMHVELEDKDLPDVGETVEAELCGSYNVLGTLDCCVLRQSVSIKRCTPDVLIYHLTPMIACPVVICTKILNLDLPTKYLGKQGDVPRSVRANSTVADSTSTTSTDFTITTTKSTDHETVFPEICPEGAPRCADGYCGVCTSPEGTPTRNTPEPASSTPLEIIRTMVPSIFTSNEPTAAVLSSTSTTTESLAVSIFGHATPISNISASDSNFTEPEDASGPSVFASNDTSGNSTSSDFTPPDTDISQNDTEAVTNTTDGEDIKTDNSTSPSNATDQPSVLTNSSDTARQPDDLNSTTFTSVVMSTPTRKATVSPSSSRVPSLSTGGGKMSSSRHPHLPATVPVPVTTSTTLQVSAGSTVVPSFSSNSTEAVRFWFTLPFNRDQFFLQLLQFAYNYSKLLTQNDTLILEEDLELIPLEDSPDNFTIFQDVRFNYPSRGGVISARHVADIVSRENFADHLYTTTNMTLLAVCPANNNCVPHDNSTGNVDITVPETVSLFEKNQALFIAVIVVAALFLLAVLLVLFYLRNRRQGTWVLAADHDEKDPEAFAIESPMTDSQIVHGERVVAVAGMPLTANGRDGSHTPDNIPAADEDNGWVVPIDQAPPPHGSAADGTATKTEDTQF